MSNFTEANIHLHNDVKNIKDFCIISNKYPFNIDVSSQNRRYVIDAKSIMGLYALDLSRPVTLTIYETGVNKDKYLEEISRFVVEG